MNIPVALRRAILFAVPLSLVTGPASAHHLMGGKLPSTFLEGLLSGLGHPVIGPEHLAVLLAVGIVVGAGRLSLLLPLAFIAAMAAGVAVHANGIAVPGTEILVALSAVIVGLMLAQGRAFSPAAWAILFAVIGFFHGYAFGESIYGAEPAPLGAYLVGLVAVQSMLTTGIALFVRRMRVGIGELAPRLAGAAVLGAGFVVLMGQLVPSA
jgi:urease accessory protein